METYSAAAKAFEREVKGPKRWKADNKEPLTGNKWHSWPSESGMQ